MRSSLAFWAADCSTRSAVADARELARDIPAPCACNRGIARRGSDFCSGPLRAFGLVQSPPLGRLVSSTAR